MSLVIHFKTSKFDVSKERENSINPFYGHSLLDWLKSELKDSVQISDPDEEDWGWYSELEYDGRNYMIGACADFERGDDPTAEIEWVFQLHKDRTLIEKILGKNKLDEADGCFALFKEFLECQPEIKELEIG